MLKHAKTFRQKLRDFEYKHTTAVILVGFTTVLLIDTALVTAILVWFSKAGYLGAFLGGLMLVWSVTAAPAAVLLLSIANNVYLPFAILVAAVGSVLGDWVILRFINDQIGQELKPMLTRYNVIPVIRKMHRTGMRWVVMLIGAIITMLPMPDEFGVALMGISSFKRRHILMICFVLNLLGLTMLLLVGRVLTGEAN